MAPLWKIQNFSGKFFLFWGWVEKDPPPWGILGFLRHFGGGILEVQKILGILDSKPWPPKSHNHREGWE